MAKAYKGETLDAITLEGVQITNTVKLSQDDSERLNRLGLDVNLVDGYNPGDPLQLRKKCTTFLHASGTVSES